MAHDRAYTRLEAMGSTAPLSTPVHFFVLACRTILKGSTEPFEVWRAERALVRSGELDADWYLTTNPDVGAMGINPTRHYVLFGSKEGRTPNSSFGPRRRSDQDLGANGLAPLPSPTLPIQTPTDQPRSKPTSDRETGPSTTPLSSAYSITVPFRYKVPIRVAAPNLAVICKLTDGKIPRSWKQYLSNIPFPYDLFLLTACGAGSTRIRPAFGHYFG